MLEEEEVETEEKNDDVENEEGDNGVEDNEQDDVESILSLLMLCFLEYSKESEGGVSLSLLPILTLTLLH